MIIIKSFDFIIKSILYFSKFNMTIPLFCYFVNGPTPKRAMLDFRSVFKPLYGLITFFKTIWAFEFHKTRISIS